MKFLQNCFAMLQEDFWRWLKTTAVLLAMMNTGMSQRTLVTTFPDMAVLTSVTNGRMATTLTWMGLLGIVGTLCTGPLFDRFDGLLLLSCGLLLQGVALGAAPWCRILVVFQVMAGIASLASAGITTGSLCINSVIWKKKSVMLNPIIQLTILTFTSGEAIAPQLIAPFLGTHRLPDAVSSTSTPRGQNITFSTNSGHLETVANYSAASNSTGGSEGPDQVHFAYILVAVLNILTAFVCFAICALDFRRTRTKRCEYRVNRIVRRNSCPIDSDQLTVVDEEVLKEPSRKRSISSEESLLQKKFEGHQTTGAGHTIPNMPTLFKESQDLRQNSELCRVNNVNAVKAATVVDPLRQDEVGNSIPPVTFSRRILPLFTIALLLFGLIGCSEAMFGGLLFTFLNGYLHWTPRDGTLLVTFFQVTRIVVHAVVVLLARCLSPTVLLVADVIVLVAASSILLVFIDAGQIFITISVILAGFATSNQCPSLITLARKCFRVDGKVMGMFMGAMSVGVAVLSPVAGLLLDSYGAVMFPVISLSISLLVVLLFTLWFVVARVIGDLQDERQVDEIVIINDRTPLIGS